MSRVITVSSRDLRSYLFSPVGYVIIALFLGMIGIIFIAQSFDQGRPATLQPVFEWGTWMLLFVCPAITMRAISEERRSGTFETLMTSPVSESEVILGKFIGALGFLCVMLIPIAAHAFVLELFGRPDYGELMCGVVGLLLAGAAFLASGLFASTLTTSQVAAFIMTFFFWVVLGVATKFLPAYVGSPFADVILAADPDPRLRDFAIGLIDTSNVVYFMVLTMAFLAASVYSLKDWRWR